MSRIPQFITLRGNDVLFEKYYALHISCDNERAAKAADDFIRYHLYVKIAEDMLTKDVKSITWHPLLKRYFTFPGPSNEDLKLSNLSVSTVHEEEEMLDQYMKKFIFDFNRLVPDAYAISCGRNMGVFKGVGYPEEIGEFFLIDKMEARSGWLIRDFQRTRRAGGEEPIHFHCSNGRLCTKERLPHMV